MGIPTFKGCFNKDTLKKIEPSSSYIINLNSEFNEKNEQNAGSHWVALITDDLKKAINMDSYGEKEPNEIKNLLKSNQYNIAHTSIYKYAILNVEFVWLYLFGVHILLNRE
jgi:hypothetical protein